ncbi:hypothetical protein [Mycobacterium intracellulare]|uniref:Uncharacterized protein n=1 Tax=Mycobacterium intracellulare (strain ATCC 13950 / DSM 43223 / JCM 6384 / NCTC 13025 / 3600) TaxID=487521 RepID=H8ITT9_MYCIA|nr:hypothetical protein [Mycobacterium intracellulare]AFC43287.1 hypothetical protein OCU_20680 [Mycobacterium intracellulare ATCC 13950]MEE3804996.1 hypothetical protein [Mycobacterium intracellulare]UQB85580.1 hypothetical protein KN249_15640 [Mycobacterium intracellulare]UQC09176.1 hypothetical protein KN251_10210 [Mycobacterium intracellulare ATCC 13950]
MACTSSGYQTGSREDFRKLLSLKVGVTYEVHLDEEAPENAQFRWREVAT